MRLFEGCWGLEKGEVATSSKTGVEKGVVALSLLPVGGGTGLVRDLGYC